MAEIKLTIPNIKVPGLANALRRLHPIPSVAVLEGEPPPELTDMQVIKGSIKIWLRDQDARYKQMTAREAITYNPDDSLLS